MSHDSTPLKRLAALAAETDAAFDRIRQRRGAQMQCRAGCSACCRARLSITRVEATWLRRGLATLDDDRRAEFAGRSRDPARQHCPALDDDGRCGVYQVRPLICRSFGVPLRRRPDVALINPPRLDVCDLNFTETRLGTLPADDVFDQTTLERSLEAIDLAFCSDADLPVRERITIASILD